MRPDVVFYQQYAVPYFGIISILAHLKYRGFKADIVIASLEKDSVETLKQLNPRLIGISVTSPEHEWLIRSSRSIRRVLPDTLILAGGVHAIFYPEEILSESCVDLVCNSEGENVMVDVVKELDKQEPDWASIPGLSYKDINNRICHNERAVLVPFDDNIVEDRSFYYEKYSQLAKDSVHRFFSSRGCPFRCSFCYNANIHDIFKGKGEYVRRKSVGNFIHEIVSEVNKYRIKSIFFYDDLFTFDKTWLKAFLQAYKKQVNIPFMCTTRANIIDEDTACMLAEAGCRTASFGVETGNYHIRKDILKKDISDDKIISCGNMLSARGIKVQTANMFCLPDETVEDALKTIDINIKAKTDYAFSALFMPFPDTALTDYCIKQGLLAPGYSVKDMPYSFLTESILRIPKRQKRVIENVHKLTYFFVRKPWLFKKFKKVVYLTFLTPVFDFIFLLGNFLRHKEERGVSLWAAVMYAWRMRGSF